MSDVATIMLVAATLDIAGAINLSDIRCWKELCEEP